MKKSIEIILFDERLLLSERYASEMIDSAKFYNRIASSSVAGSIYLSAAMLRDGLRINSEKIKWINPIKKFRMIKLLSVKSLMHRLTFSEIDAFNTEILILEGADREELKKKHQTNVPQTS